MEKGVKFSENLTTWYMDAPEDDRSVASLEDQNGPQSICKLEVFSVIGKHLRTIELGNRKPSGIRIQDGILYMADVVRKKIDIFSIIEKDT